MKKLIVFLALLTLIASSAGAEIRLTEDATTIESKIAAGEYGAVDAYFSPADDNIYYLAKADDGYSVVIFGENGDYQPAYHFDDGSAYVCIRTGEDGGIYLVKQQADESMKSSIVHLKPDGDSYFEVEYVFPAASSDLIPHRFEFSSESSSGFVLSYMNISGEYVPVMSVFNVLWGSLEGYDAFVTIRPGALTAEVIPMANCFDVYGYADAGAEALAAGVAAGELLSPTDACLSPGGDRVLVTVPYMENTLVYVIDVYSLSLELVYPPEGFSGSIGWNEEGTLTALSDSGESTEILVGGFSVNSWDQSSWEQGWADDAGWGAPVSDDWGNS